jgi:transposase
MLTTEQINDLHRLYWSEHWPIRKIERQLNIGWRTIRKYLDAPAQSAVHRDRPSKLDPFKSTIAEWLEKDPGVSAAVIEQKLRAAGYPGGHSILREYVRNARPQITRKRAFVRMEPLAGERFEVDWGHFGSLSYSGDVRKLYAFALVDAHSRMLYVEFTHSQSFETFARCHIHAFTALGGIAREIAYDNLATAVVEHDGRLVRFLPRFLAFAREYGFYPHACNPASGWEKGKIERAIGYLRQNFWPLREFTDLHDVNRQVRQWLAEVANQRVHRETRQRPLERFQPEALKPLPVIPYDYRECTEALVHKDLRLAGDASSSRPTPAPSPFTTVWKRSSVIRVRGGAVKPSAPTASNPSWPKAGLRLDALRHSSDCSTRLTVCACARLSKPISATWPTAIVLSDVRSPNCWN